MQRIYYSTKITLIERLIKELKQVMQLDNLLDKIPSNESGVPDNRSQYDEEALIIKLIKYVIDMDLDMELVVKARNSNSVVALIDESNKVKGVDFLDSQNDYTSYLNFVF